MNPVRAAKSSPRGLFVRPKERHAKLVDVLQDNLAPSPLSASLPGSPFVRLRALLDAHAPSAPPVSLALGEPQHGAPDFVLAELARPTADYGKYPPITGTPEWRHAVSDWLGRRFGLDAALLETPSQILPLNGTREGLFLAMQLAPQKPDGRVAMPDPFYQVYAAAALAAQAQPVYLPAPRATGFLPDLDAIAPETYDKLQALYLCSPANPQGAIADAAYLRKALALARAHGFLLLVDECYAEIYDAPHVAPPVSMLEIMQAEADDNAPVIVFHSLSKRSNLPGLRSGFCAGGRDIMQRFAALRQIAGPQSPLPVLNAAMLAWQDDDHVAANRALYVAKCDDAEAQCDGRFGFYRPPGGFFLWLDVGDSAAATLHLWQAQGVRVLPGAYLTRLADTPQDPASNYIRVALVAPPEESHAAIARLVAGLEDFTNGSKPVAGGTK